MSRCLTTLTLLAACFFSFGCTQVKVAKVKCSSDPGIRYYRPKPYLFITASAAASKKPSNTVLEVNQKKPFEVEEKKASAAIQRGVVRLAAHQEEADRPPLERPQGDVGLPNPNTDRKASSVGDTDGAGTAKTLQAISMKLEYLPDFAEEYAINFRPGLGSGELNVSLENGWNLTSIGVKTDQQTDEIIGSVASLLTSAAPVFNKSAPEEADGSMIYGSNIPFGFYEAVIACGPDGRKQLYGWRYVGFMPFQSCPTSPRGLQEKCCNTDAIYGMVFVNGVLQFQEIGSIPKTPVSDKGQPIYMESSIQSGG